jgi:hypothetical protein
MTSPLLKRHLTQLEAVTSLPRRFNPSWPIRFPSSCQSSQKITLISRTTGNWHLFAISFLSFCFQTKYLLYFHKVLVTRARICKGLRSPGIDSKESFPRAFIGWLAGTITPHRWWIWFLGIDSRAPQTFQIRAPVLLLSLKVQLRFIFSKLITIIQYHRLCWVHRFTHLCPYHLVFTKIVRYFGVLNMLTRPRGNRHRLRGQSVLNWKKSANKWKPRG